MRLLIIISLACLLITCAQNPAKCQINQWQAGIAKAVITPQTPVWLAGYGTARPPDGKIHDLWVKVLCLKDPTGKRVVMATTDHMGMSKTIYESLCTSVRERFGLERAEFMITFSHNHCGPVLNDDLVDYYPLDDEQRRLVDEYTEWMETQVVAAVGEALSNLRPARLLKGEGQCTFAVNRRENTEAEVPQLWAEGKPLKGVVDHYVPVLAIKGADDGLRGVLFGYACHPTTLSFNTWCGDFPGFAQVDLEAKHSGATAMFFNACGADQNPIPRGKLELAEKYGRMLAEVVEEVLAKPMQSVMVGMQTAFAFVDLPYESLVTREALLPVAHGTSELHARWANRMLQMIDEGVVFPTSYPYPVQAWRFGQELLFIGIGGEAVVDYSLRFKREFGTKTWVCGQREHVACTIPQRAADQIHCFACAVADDHLRVRFKAAELLVLRVFSKPPSVALPDQPVCCWQWLAATARRTPDGRRALADSRFRCCTHRLHVRPVIRRSEGADATSLGTVGALS